MWVGAIPTIAYALLIANRHAWVQVIMVACIMLIILLSLFVALSLQYPFTGEVSISPEVFQDLLESFHRRLLESGS